ncbi:MAG TPA: hypothetical protein IGS53_22005 [Leptolyngbyaceae cyanobacterium M33_DOE_097]|uniref:Uncharacterized protein n=1 Tax=Oscillatoriales cyanobacterium SpSt-418 TaxID=2282169 RepID=A0A7C3PNE0_9CYAN|nr:hypothetical protein [Leptolyngbyaceae cyanobacterium M33_DOE_097]
MAAPRFLPLLHRLGWEFWVPLPVIAGLFWIMGNSIAVQVLSRPYQSVNKLQADTQLDMKLSVTILSMTAKIDRSRGSTTIAVKTSDSTLRKLEYEFSATEVNQIERAIAQELEMSITDVRKLVSYQIKE